jgi:hypothetical protein
MQYVPVSGQKNTKKEVKEEETSKNNTSNQEASGTASNVKVKP